MSALDFLWAGLGVLAWGLGILLAVGVALLVLLVVLAIVEGVKLLVRRARFASRRKAARVTPIGGRR